MSKLKHNIIFLEKISTKHIDLLKWVNNQVM